MGVIYRNKIKFGGGSGSGGQTIQVEVLPTPTIDLVGTIYQYVGPTESGLINGFFYECVEDSLNPGTYLWLSKDVQIGGHQILDEGTSLSARTGLNFTDFDVSDNASDDQTEIQMHRLSSSELDEIFTDLPSVPAITPSRGFTPVGTVITVIGLNAPGNYAKCDGTVYPISTFPELADYFISQFGVANYYGGDGTNTFAVPDLRSNDLSDAMFCIAVKNIYIDMIDERNMYSTTEKVVGEWINGKPLYQKTFTFSPRYNSWDQQFNVPYRVEYSEYQIDNIEKIISATLYSEGFQQQSASVPGVFECGAVLQPGGYILFYAVNTVTAVAATLRYTKTTD